MLDLINLGIIRESKLPSALAALIPRGSFLVKGEGRETEKERGRNRRMRPWLY